MTTYLRRPTEMVAGIVNKVYEQVGGYNSPPIRLTSATGGPCTSDDQSDADAALICRICLDGPGATNDKDESLGRLLSPCRCRGTMKYVHAGCLLRWRLTSSNSSSAMRCDQCRSPYRFRNSRIFGLARSPWVLLPTSSLVFLVLIWFVGFVAALLLERSQGPLEMQAARLDALRLGNGAKDVVFIGGGSRAGTRVMTLDVGASARANDVDDCEDDDYGFDGYYSWWQSSDVVMWDGISALIRSSLREATGLMAPKVKIVPATEKHIQLLEGRTQTSGKLSKISEAWRRWRAHRHDAEDAVEHGHLTATTSSPTLTPVAQVPISIDANLPTWTRSGPEPVQTTPAVEPTSKAPHVQDRSGKEDLTLVIQPFSMIEKVPLQRESSDNCEYCEREADAVFPTLVAYGILLVGLGSFSALCLSLHMPFMVGQLFTRLARGGRRRRGGGGAGGVGSSEDARLMLLLVVVLFVLVGLVRALGVVYKLVQNRTAKLLIRLEDFVIDWVGDEDELGAGRAVQRAVEAAAAAAAGGARMQDGPDVQADALHARQRNVDDEDPVIEPGFVRNRDVAWAFAQRAMEFQWEDDDEEEGEE